MNFLYTADAQRLWVKAGFSPRSNPDVRAQFASEFPMPPNLWTINDFGGWFGLRGIETLVLGLIVIDRGSSTRMH
jgi:ABC-type sulfate transport system substrate-binding protein